eukprot:TRINITY_DN5296_c0_g1_i1.p1 TRINITY_DN5296_c0_g1~~TRINITY_DN5296_c0_g1_i1.p1  ORF type:complete len:106 (+),score=3.88 TRINITY_DN5296_c0_g1_i1:364-681(+)
MLTRNTVLILAHGVPLSTTFYLMLIPLDCVPIYILLNVCHTIFPSLQGSSRSVAQPGVPDQMVLNSHLPANRDNKIQPVFQSPAKYKPILHYNSIVTFVNIFSLS